MLTVKDGPGFYRGQFFSRLQLDLVLLLVEEMKLSKMIIGIGAKTHLLLVLPSPLPLPAADAKEFSLGQIGVHNGMYRQNKILMLMIEQIT